MCVTVISAKFNFGHSGTSFTHLSIAVFVIFCTLPPPPQVVGMLSIKDLLKEVTREKEELLTKITEFKLGRGGFFEHT